MTTSHLHVIPVDASLTVEQAWRELCLMGVRTTDTGSTTWAGVGCDGTECEGIAADLGLGDPSDSPIVRNEAEIRRRHARPRCQVEVEHVADGHGGGYWMRCGQWLPCPHHPHDSDLSQELAPHGPVDQLVPSAKQEPLSDDHGPA